MKITNLKIQTRDKNRVNVFIDDVYQLSLDVYQITELGIKIGLELDEVKLQELKKESQFGKTYTQAVNYCFLRPHSLKEMRDYLFKKTLAHRNKQGQLVHGISPNLIPRVLERLTQKGYIDDEKFATFWVENRFLKKGISQYKLTKELQKKGVSSDVIEKVLATTERNDNYEIQKIIAKKASHYNDKQKLMKYLVGLGFKYDLAKKNLENFYDN